MYARLHADVTHDDLTAALRQKIALRRPLRRPHQRGLCFPVLPRSTVRLRRRLCFSTIHVEASMSHVIRGVDCTGTSAVSYVDSASDLFVCTCFLCMSVGLAILFSLGTVDGKRLRGWFGELA